jgi:hypothetical protein
MIPIPQKNPNDLTPEFDRLMEVLRKEFIDCQNISNFLNTHQRVVQLYTMKIQAQLDKIPELANKQVKEITINASPEAIHLMNSLESLNKKDISLSAKVM